MNEAPKGKIGRLPKAIQEQVNRRLDNAEKGRPLVAWLNSLPEVQADFQIGCPVSVPPFQGGGKARAVYPGLHPGLSHCGLAALG